jgi:hypothetical protein
MCRCSHGNVAGFVRLQRPVGQEVAASLLTVFPFDPQSPFYRGRHSRVERRWTRGGIDAQSARSPLEHLAPLLPSSDAVLTADRERVDAFLPRWPSNRRCRRPPTPFPPAVRWSSSPEPLCAASLPNVVSFSGEHPPERSEEG